MGPKVFTKLNPTAINDSNLDYQLDSKPIRIYLGGINGVGKTTVSKNLSDLGFKVIRGSSILLNYFCLSMQKELETLSKKSKQEVMENIVPAILKSEEKVVFDAHFIGLTINGYDKSSLNKNIATQVTHLVHLSAAPEIIFDRRVKDLKNRERIIDLDLIKIHQIESEKTADLLAKKYSLPLLFVDNTGIPENAAGTIFRWVND